MNLLVSSLVGTLASVAAVLGSYDFAFIVFAVVTYIVLAPFSYRGQRTICQIQRARPAVENLKKQFKDDRRKLNEGILTLYRDRQIAVVGVMFGWIPLLAQALLLVAIYLAIPALPPDTADTRIPWLTSLSAPDPLFILPLLMGAVVLFRWQVTTKFNPPRGSVIKKGLMLVVHGSAAFVSAVLPAGVTLFWLTYTALMTGQEYLVMRYFKKHVSPTTT